MSRQERLRALWPFLAHVPVALWLFTGLLFEGRVLFFRDITAGYFPDYTFAGQALRRGIWPLWNPTADAGAPFLLAYPVDLLLIVLTGAKGALSVGPTLHLLLAMCGATALARAMGCTRAAAWAAGLFYGLSGFLLSAVNTVELFEASAWAPWVLLACLALAVEPSPRRVVPLALAAALQVTTLSAEVLIQTAVAALVLAGGRRLVSRRLLLAYGGAALLALALAAPALLGARALIEGTQRAAGFTPKEAFAWSARPMVLWDALLPRFFGDVHTFSDLGYWGQPFFPEGYPYVLSLYLGPCVALLAALAGRRAPAPRLWALVALGVLVSLGSHGPLEWILRPLFRHLRTPVKFFFLADLGLCLLAGLGVDRLLRTEKRPRPWMFAVPAALLVLGAGLLLQPDLPARALGGLVPALLDPRSRWVVARAWPGALLVTGSLALAVCLACMLPARWAALAAAAAGLDLLMINGNLNPAAPASFYELRPDVKSMVGIPAGEGGYRWFSYGVVTSPLHWAPWVARLNSDVVLYYLDRQTLWARTKFLDGLDGAYDEDRYGWAPPGSTLTGVERSPSLHRVHHGRLRRAGVRWVLSFQPLPEDLVQQRAQVALPEVAEPLRLYEVRGVLPRVFWVPRCEVVPASRVWERLESATFDPGTVLLRENPPGNAPCGAPSTGASGSVTMERPDPHTVRLTARGAPGFIVVLEGHHRAWRAAGPEGEVPLLVANERYWALPTPGGERTYVVRYRPAWVRPSVLLSAAAGSVGVLLAALGRRGS
jgi:hypothetical protein